jgi:recombination protein RecA
MGDRNMGLQARLMSQAMRKLTGTIARTNTTCIFINQLREKIGQMFGPTETTTGGNALKFYASVRIDIRSRNPIKDGDDVLGRRAYIKVVKNKVAPPFKRAEFDVMFGEGISRAGEVLDLGVEYNIITKSGSWFSYDGEKLAQGRDAAKKVIQDNPELYDELEKKVYEAMKAADASPETAARRATRERLEGENATGDEAEAAPATAPTLDDSLDDEFSIEEDLN